MVDPKRLIYGQELNYKEKIGANETLPRHRGRANRASNVNTKEDAIIAAIDQKSFLLRHASWIEKIQSGEIGVRDLFDGVAPDVAIQLLRKCYEGSEKTQMAAIDSLLDRAGFGKTQKHAILGAIDSKMPKEALVSIILGAKKELAEEGIEITDDEDQDQPEGD